MIGATVEEETEWALAWLRRHSSKRNREGTARFAIPSEHALGVSVSDIRTLGKKIGRNHALAAALWKTGVYEARMLASFVDDPARVTSAQMDRWCREFDNWAICDTLCFALFDRTPSAWEKIAQWRKLPGEFQKRAAFALLWALTVHDKQAENALFEQGLGFIEEAATDSRNFVRKAVNMALRATGKRNLALNKAALKVARRLAESPDATARWVGRDALRELTSTSVARRIAKRRQSPADRTPGGTPAKIRRLPSGRRDR